MITPELLRATIQRDYGISWAKKEQVIANYYQQASADDMTPDDRQDAYCRLLRWRNSYRDETPPWEEENAPVSFVVTRRDDARTDRAWEAIDDGRI